MSNQETNSNGESVIMQSSNIRSWRNTYLVCYTEKKWFKFLVKFNIIQQHTPDKTTPKIHKRTGAAKQNNQHKPNQTVLNLTKNPIVNIPNMYALSLSLRFIFPLLSFFFFQELPNHVEQGFTLVKNIPLAMGVVWI